MSGAAAAGGEAGEWSAELLPWHSRYGSQLYALVRKNYILLARHTKARRDRAGVIRSAHL